MSDYTNCNHLELEDGTMICEDVYLSSGEVCTAYLGPCGVYVLATGPASLARTLYQDMRELLGTVHVRLYMCDFGPYDPGSNTCTAELDDAALSADIDAWISQRRPLYKPDVLARMVERLEIEDARARGYKVGEDGQLYIYRHDRFVLASPYSSDTNYLLTLFGGTLGLHRFAVGKVFSGIAYFLTGGLFLCGWLLDLLSLFLGIQKDKKKRYLTPLTDRRKKLFLLPLGLVAGVLLFLIYSALMSRLTGALGGGVTQQIQGADPQGLQSFFDMLFDAIPGLEQGLSQ